MTDLNGSDLSRAALPRDVRKALDVLEADPVRDLTIKELADFCGVASRTLQKHFRSFLGKGPRAVQHALRLRGARRDLLSGAAGLSVTCVALRWGFRHLGRFGVLYRRHFGESPSETLRSRRAVVDHDRLRPRVQLAAERPLIGVLPFECHGVKAHRAGGIAAEIEAALACRPWISVVAAEKARYRLRGTLQTDARGRIRVVAILTDASTGRSIWADRWDGEQEDCFAFQERVATNAARALERAVRDAESALADRKSAEELGAWQLTMKALPLALSIEAMSQGRALELLERAMELAPADPLPLALAAWCHGQRSGHYFTARPALERQKALDIAAHAACLNAGDPAVEALIGSAYTLAHDLARASVHFERALAIDGGCVWAWNRSGWVSLYQGDAAQAIERFQIARRLDPDDPLSFFCTLGIAASHFESGRYAEAARWFSRSLAEHPSAVWVNRFRAPAYALAGRIDEARRSMVELASAYPDLTIAQVRAALPNTPGFLDRQAEGLELAGMHP